MICDYIMISDVEHLFVYRLAICEYSLEKMSIYILCSFFNQVLWGEKEYSEFFVDPIHAQHINWELLKLPQ